MVVMGRLSVRSGRLCSVAASVLVWSRAFKAMALGAWKDAMEARRLSRCLRIGASLQLHASLASWVVRARLKGFMAFLSSSALALREKRRVEVDFCPLAHVCCYMLVLALPSRRWS